MDDTEPPPPDSLMPYAAWTEDALRQVAVRALRHAAEHGLPGEHHFYITFRTDQAGVVIPTRLLAQYPQEMTIVLQHQFWDLQVAPDGGFFSVGLSFGGVGSLLTVPVAALTGFADPLVRFGLRFTPVADAEEAAPPPEPEPEPEPPPEASEAAETGAVVSLDKFRRRKD